LPRLIHGTTIHGQQSLDPIRRGEPLMYYHRASPIGQVFNALHDDPRVRNVGLVGLGAGSLAAYAQAGQDFTFFEIDPSVIRIARDPRLFTFLSGSEGDVRIIAGDARLKPKERDDRL